MKKSKFLIGLSSISCLGLSIPQTITSCSCSNRFSVRYVTHLYDRQFNDRSGGCTFRFKVNNGNVAQKTTVKLVELYVDDELLLAADNLIDYWYDSDGYIKVVLDTNWLMYWYPWAYKFNFKFLFTNSETKETVTLGSFTLNYDDTFKIYEFEQCDWSVIKERTDALYSGSMTEEEFLSLFSWDGEKFESLDNFVGLEKDVYMNGVYHTFRIIGVKHDTIAEGEYAGKPALFTFDLESLLSDENGNAILSVWNPTKNNTNYISSSLKSNLTGTPVWSSSKNVYQMLTNNETGTPELTDLLKMVTKEYHYRENNKWYAGTYNDTIFSLSYCEFAKDPCPTSYVEGTRYQYWIDHPDEDDWKKDDLAGNNQDYWTITACVDRWFVDNNISAATTYSFAISNKYGTGFAGKPTNTSLGVSFAFCI